MTENDYEKLRLILIEKGYSGENSLPVQARSSEDPGADYFVQLKSELKQLFDLLEGEEKIDRILAAALFGLSHVSYTNYEAAIHHGVKFRDTLIDPDLIEIEMAVESIFSGEWIEL